MARKKNQQEEPSTKVMPEKEAEKGKEEGEKFDLDAGDDGEEPDVDVLIAEQEEKKTGRRGTPNKDWNDEIYTGNQTPEKQVFNTSIAGKHGKTRLAVSEGKLEKGRTRHRVEDLLARRELERKIGNKLGDGEADDIGFSR